MMSVTILPQLSLSGDRQYLKVILKSTAHVLDCLSLNEHLEAQPLVEESVIYLSPSLPSAECSLIPLEEHYLKVFFKVSVSAKESLAFSKTLKNNPLVKDTEFHLDLTLIQSDRLRIYLLLKKHQREAEELLAFLRRQTGG